VVTLACRFGNGHSMTVQPPFAPVQSGLRVQGLGKRYDGAAALADFAMTVAKGEVVALMGPNGAGKSTLYRLLVGAERPEFGQITLDGIDLTRLPSHGRARAGLRHLPQDPSAFRGLTVEDNLRLAVQSQDPDRSAHTARLEALILDFGLAALRSKRPAQLSGGQRRMCEIARLMAGRPRVLLLDEPFSGLDPLAVQSLCNTIGDLRQQGLGVVITDHDVRSVQGLADRMIVLQSGRVLVQGPTEAVLRDPAARGGWLGADFRL